MTDAQAAGPGDSIPPAAIEAYLQLSRKLNILMGEEEVVHLFVDMLAGLVPGYKYAIRLVHEIRGDLTLVYALGPLAAGVRERVFLTPESIGDDQAQATLMRSLPKNVEILDRAPCIFEGCEHASLTALTDGERFFGTLHVECGGGRDFRPGQVKLMAALTHHLSVSLRNAKLYRETTALRDLLGKLIDNANAPILIVDGKRRIRTFNRTLEQLTGYSRTQLAGTDFLELFEQNDRQRFVSVIVKAMRGVPTTGFEIGIPRKAGGTVHVSFNITSVLDQFGRVEAVIAVGQDLTEIRRLQSQMIHSERLATIGQLAAGVVHEINNPLTSIAVYSEFLLHKAEAEGQNADVVKRLARINQSADRIFRFTQELMTFARPTGEEPTLIDLRDVINKSIGFCEHVFHKFHVTVEREFEQDLPLVYGIEAQLEQVFVNLITNACHAMRSSGGRLLFRVLRGHEGTLQVDVVDEGEGMHPESLKMIFDPFYTTKVEGEGTGLGLSIVKNIITNHDGDITVKSAPGEGTTFTLTLYASE